MARDNVARIESAKPAHDPFEDLSPEAARDAARNLTRRVIEQGATIEHLGRDNDLLRAAQGEREPADGPRLQVLWPSEAIDSKPLPQLVQGLITRGGLVVIFGESNCGKSTLALDLGLHVAGGKPWRGRRVARGLVLILAGEGLAGLQLRLAAAIREGIGSKGMPLAIVAGMLNLASTEGLADVLDTIRAAESDCGEQTALVVVDTLARCAAIDENDGQQLGLVIRACDKIRAVTGAAVALVHHSGKDPGKGARGHSSLRAAVDTELLVDGRCNPRTVSVTKQRDLSPAEPMGFDLVPIKVATDPETFEDTTACIVRHSDQAPAAARPSGKQQSRLLAELERLYSIGQVTWTDAELRKIGRDLGMGKSSARDALVGLSAAQYLVPSVGGQTLRQPPESPS